MNPPLEAIERYYQDVLRLPNESAKTHRFAELIGELFPNTKPLTDFAQGWGKFIRCSHE